MEKSIKYTCIYCKINEPSFCVTQAKLKAYTTYTFCIVPSRLMSNRVAPPHSWAKLTLSLTNPCYYISVATLRF